MLPSPTELRDLAQSMREAVPKASTGEMKRLLAGHAFLIAQIAEQLSRNDVSEVLVGSRNIARLDSMPANALDDTTKSVVQSLLRGDNNISACRMRAEELRAIADEFTVPSVQKSLLRRIADIHEQIAEDAEDQLAVGRQALGKG